MNIITYSHMKLGTLPTAAAPAPRLGTAYAETSEA